MVTRAKTPKTSKTRKPVVDQEVKNPAETPAITHQFAETSRHDLLNAGVSAKGMVSARISARSANPYSTRQNWVSGVFEVFASGQHSIPSMSSTAEMHRPLLLGQRVCIA